MRKVIQIILEVILENEWAYFATSFPLINALCCICFDTCNSSHGIILEFLVIVLISLLWVPPLLMYITIPILVYRYLRQKKYFAVWIFLPFFILTLFVNPRSINFAGSSELVPLFIEYVPSNWIHFLSLILTIAIHNILIRRIDPVSRCQ